MQRNYTEVRSEGEKLYLNSHQLKIGQSKKSRNRILMQSLSWGTPTWVQVFQFYHCQCRHSKLWRRGLGIKNKTYFEWFVPCDCSLTIHQSHWYCCISCARKAYLLLRTLTLLFLSREYLSLESSNVSPSTTSSHIGFPQLGWALIEDLTGEYSTWDRPLCLRR